MNLVPEGITRHINNAVYEDGNGSGNGKLVYSNNLAQVGINGTSATRLKK